ncbi:uncharacterized protein C2orf72 homolog isoform X2 [Pelodiscus sinensis]|uniref:uncharacterized protein C2orf72 homolog isoform X2 n=1 Tax=Pelodiscus sinensis TaxID=13735 RepID=UPI003F6A55C7
MEEPAPGPGEQALQELQALVELVGGKPQVLLAGEALEGGETRALLGAFARELFGEPPGAPAGVGAKPRAAPQVRVSLGPGGAGREIRAPLVFLLCRAGSLRPRRARARLREIARDLRSRLPRAPPAALVGVLVQPGPGQEEAEARRLLETLLREVFPGLQDTVQAAAYGPGRPDGALEARGAACRALRAALEHRAAEPHSPVSSVCAPAGSHAPSLPVSPPALSPESLQAAGWSRLLLESGGEEREKRRLPSILQCIPWGRRSRRRGSSAKAANNIHEVFPGLSSLSDRSGEDLESESPL